MSSTRNGLPLKKADQMRAFAKVRASLVFMTAIGAVAELTSYSECAAQDYWPRRMFYVTVENYSGHEIGPGQLELWVEQPDGSEKPADPSMTEGIPNLWSETYAFDVTVIQPGAHFRLVYRADCADDSTKRVYFRSVSFLYWPSQNRKKIEIYPVSLLENPGNKGKLVRLEVRKNGGLPDKVDVNPDTLIEIDYIFDNDMPRIEPRPGSHPEVVAVSSIGPRFLVVNGKRTGIASYFQVKKSGEDRVSILVDGVPRHLHIWSAP
jgi:hypothetical protein